MLSKVFTILHCCGWTPLLGLLIATIVAHAKIVSDNKDSDYDVYDTKLLAIYFTASYTAVVMYGLATVVFILFQLVLKTYQGLFCVIFAVFDSAFIICVGGALLSSTSVSTANGGGVAMFIFAISLLIYKVFPVLFYRIDVLRKLALENQFSSQRLMRLLLFITAIVGCLLVLTQAVTVLAMLIKLYDGDNRSYIAYSLNIFTVLIALTSGLLASTICFCVEATEWIGRAVDVLSFFTQASLGFSLNQLIVNLYYEFTDSSDDENSKFIQGVEVTLAVSTIALGIVLVCISALKPFVPFKNQEGDVRENEKLVNT